MADLLIKPSTTVELPILHPETLDARMPRSAWALVGGALLAGVGAFVPWFAPHGRITSELTVPTGDLYGWDLLAFGFVAAALLAATGVVAAVLIAFDRRTVVGRLKARAVLGWAALVLGLISIVGVYAAWRHVPEQVGIGRDPWDEAIISGFSLTTGPQLGAYLVVIGALVATLVGAWLLKILVRVVALSYLGVLVVLPVYTVVQRTFEAGAKHIWDLMTSDPEFLDAARLTAIVAGFAVLVNTIFGLGISLLLTRYRFPGQRVLSRLIDLPLAISPVVVGVALILVFGQQGWFGDWLQDIGFQVIFSTPGMVLGTVIVALPLVVREVVPVLEEAGIEQEQAAQSLGANSWQVFRRITLPTIKWALAYGIVLSLARSIGEFGAVRVVSRSVSGESQTLTLYINHEYEQLGQDHQNDAYIGSFALMLLAALFIIIIAVLRPDEHRIKKKK